MVEAGRCPRLGKMQHETFGEAMKVAERLEAEGTGHGEQIAYQCQHCDRWHLTSKKHKYNRGKGRP
jgi:hypothetical protein